MRSLMLDGVHIRLTGLLIMVILLISACGADRIDYSGAEEVEKALENGEDLSGKTVSLVVNYSTMFPRKYGYEIDAGEYLYLYSEDNWDVHPGDEICIKILSVAGVRDDYIIRYEMLSDVDRIE